LRQQQRNPKTKGGQKAMVRCASLFSQLVALFSRVQFQQLVLKHGAERYSKGYSSWDHFVAMLFCQLAQTKSILILADNGGSNRPSSVPLKYHLWNSLCLQHGLTVTVCHHPTGASKWNLIEHRIFSEISKNWADEPLVSLQTTLNFIRKTKTDSGLRVSAMLNRKHYLCKEKISKEDAAQMIVQRDPVSPDLNYKLLPPKC
jgi:hypothetical protein